VLSVGATSARQSQSAVIVPRRVRNRVRRDEQTAAYGVPQRCTVRRFGREADVRRLNFRQLLSSLTASGPSPMLAGTNNAVGMPEAEKILILGAGPTGLAAALFLAEC
jgi:NADPH-dependent glutamate synthase beta subunit-like oxidoreductase